MTQYVDVLNLYAVLVKFCVLKVKCKFAAKNFVTEGYTELRVFNISKKENLTYFTRKKLAIKFKNDQVGRLKIAAGRRFMNATQS